MARSKLPRTEGDAYYTPPELASAIVSRLGVRPGDRVLEPSVGGGAFVPPLLGAGAEVYACDSDMAAAGFKLVPPARFRVADFGQWGGGSPWPEVEPFDLIVGNPPYSAVDEHLAVALRLARRVVFVLRSTWLSSGFRALDLVELTPSRMWMPSPRPSFRADGATDSAPAMVIEWRRGEIWQTRFEVLPWRPTGPSSRAPAWPDVVAAWHAGAEPGQQPSTAAQHRARRALLDAARSNPSAVAPYRGTERPVVELLPWCGRLETTDCEAILATLEAP